ncbi:ERF family protein [Candidatus Pacearchaeota archaeon]|nr:ERF family protein [Candidatus Pacearchaeota archaeon]
MSKIKKEPGMVIKEVSETKKKTPLKTTKEVAVQRAEKIQAPAESQSTDLVTVAVNKGMPIEYVRELIALKNQQEDREIAAQERQARIQFDADKAIMQAEFEPVKKTKENKQYKSNYADLPALQRQYGPTISKHGFAYDFYPDFDKDGSAIVYFRLKKYGYTEKTPVPMPAYKPEGKQMNDMQAVGTIISYGGRYAMKAGLGVAEEDEDTDGNLDFNTGVKYADEIRALQGCKDSETLSAAWATIYNDIKAHRDRDALKVLSAVYDAKKKELSK